jgi:hypothetical protein
MRRGVSQSDEKNGAMLMLRISRPALPLIRSTDSPSDELHRECVLEEPDLSAHGGLGNAEFLRRLGKAQRARHGLEGAKRGERRETPSSHSVIISCYAMTENIICWCATRRAKAAIML